MLRVFQFVAWALIMSTSHKQHSPTVRLFLDHPWPRLHRRVIDALRCRQSRRVTFYMLRHFFASHIFADDYDILMVQETGRHKGVRTTMIYAHVLNGGGRGVRSPVDALPRSTRDTQKPSSTH